MSESFETREIGKLFNLNFILNCNMYLKVRTLALYKVFVTVVGFFCDLYDVHVHVLHVHTVF